MERDGFEVCQGGKWYAYVSLLQADVIRGFVKCGIIMYDMIFKHPSTHTHIDRSSVFQHQRLTTWGQQTNFPNVNGPVSLQTIRYGMCIIDGPVVQNPSLEWNGHSFFRRNCCWSMYYFYTLLSPHKNLKVVSQTGTLEKASSLGKKKIDSWVNSRVNSFNRTCELPCVQYDEDQYSIYSAPFGVAVL